MITEANYSEKLSICEGLTYHDSSGHTRNVLIIVIDSWFRNDLGKDSSEVITVLHGTNDAHAYSNRTPQPCRVNASINEKDLVFQKGIQGL